MTVPPIAEMRKALVAIAALIAEILSAGLLHGTALHWAVIASGAIGAVLVWLTPNAAPTVPTVAEDADMGSGTTVVDPGAISNGGPPAPPAAV